jgi:hypothetical protein
LSIQTLAVPGTSKEGFVSRDALGSPGALTNRPDLRAQYAFPALYVFDIAPG